MKPKSNNRKLAERIVQALFGDVGQWVEIQKWRGSLHWRESKKAFTARIEAILEKGVK